MTSGRRQAHLRALRAYGLWYRGVPFREIARLLPCTPPKSGHISGSRAQQIVSNGRSLVWRSCRDRNTPKPARLQRKHDEDVRARAARQIAWEKECKARFKADREAARRWRQAVYQRVRDAIAAVESAGCRVTRLRFPRRCIHELFGGKGYGSPTMFGKDVVFVPTHTWKGPMVEL